MQLTNSQYFSLLAEERCPCQRRPPDPDRIWQWHQTRMEEQTRRAFYGIRFIFSGDHNNNRLDRHYKMWEGGTYGPGACFTCIWPDVVRHLVRICANPAEYIYLQFLAYSMGNYPLPPSHMLKPSDLTTQTATHVYSRQHAPMTEQTWESSDEELGTLQLEVPVIVRDIPWHRGHPWRHELHGIEGQWHTALYYYCLAAADNCQRLQEHFHDPALRQYAFQRAEYDRAWGTRIPARLRSEADQLIPAILSSATESPYVNTLPRDTDAVCRPT